MSCPLPPHQCGKYLCPTHPKEISGGEEALCPRGVTCSQGTCLLRHNFKLPNAGKQKQSRGSSQTRNDFGKERKQFTAYPKPRAGDKSRKPAAGRKKGPNPFGDAKPVDLPRGQGQQQGKSVVPQQPTEASQPDSVSTSWRGAPKSNKPGIQNYRKNDPAANVENKYGCPLSEKACHKWECSDHPRSPEEFSQTDTRPCMNGPSCSRADCYYSHDPQNRPSCPLREDECAKYHCPTHPNNSPQATNSTHCRHGVTCYFIRCAFDHDPPLLTQRIPCGAPALARLRAEVKPPQTFADFFDLNRSINLKVKKDSIYLSGLVTSQLMTQNVDKVSTWIEDNSPKQGQIGPLAQHHSIWYDKVGSSQFAALAARKQVKIDYSAKMNRLFIRGQSEQVDEAQAEVEALLNDLKSHHVNHINHIAGLHVSKRLAVMNEVLGEDSECCLFHHEDEIYLIGSSANPQLAEIVEELRAIKFDSDTMSVPPMVIANLKKSGFQLCREHQDRFDIVITVGDSSLQVAGALHKIAEFQRHIDSDTQVWSERVDVPPMVNQYLRRKDRFTLVTNFVKDQGKNVQLSPGSDKRPKKDEEGRFYIALEGSRRDEVREVADEMRQMFASMEAGVVKDVITLEPYQDHILNCRQPELESLAIDLGIWQDRDRADQAKLMYRHVTSNGRTIELLSGDIVEQRVDVLVNAANSKLKHNGGVAAAIEKKAQIQAACRHRVETEGRVTAGSCWRGGAGNLKTAGAILHAVGPRWLPGCDMDATRAVLEQTMASIFHEANQCEARTMALPLISIRIFNRLGEENETNIMQIITESVQKLLQEDTSLQVVRFVELDQARVKKFLAVLVDKLGDTNDSLRKAETLLAEESTALAQQRNVSTPASTIPWKISCVPQVNLPSAIQELKRFLRTHTYEEVVEHDLLPAKEDLMSLCHNHHVVVDYDSQDCKCSLRGDRSAVHATYRDIVQKMHVSRPKDWTKEDGCVELSPSDPEWHTAVASFTETFPQATICKLERIQHMGLYQQFHAQLNYVRGKMGGLDPPCKLLFHGSGRTSPEQILSHPNGFTRSYAGVKGLWGKGTYFAERAIYSHLYTHSLSEKIFQMFLVDVIVGEHIKLHSDRQMVDAPRKPDGGFYDSVQGRTRKTDVYITYNDNRQYPKYVITYSVPGDVPIDPEDVPDEPENVVGNPENTPNGDNPDQSCIIS